MAVPWRRIGQGAVAVLLVPAVVVGWRLAPLVVDDMAMDRIVVAVALDWRDFGREKAVERLQYELDHQRVGAYVQESDCALVEGDDQDKVVSCAWRVQLDLIAFERTLALASEARIDRNGVLVR